MRLFRYFDRDGGLATLRTQTMRFGSPLGFNDPFELTPRIEEVSDELLLRKLQSDFWVNEFYERSGKQSGMSEAQSREEYFAKELPQRFEHLRNPDVKSKRALKLKWELIGIFAKSFRLLCCSHRDDSILMWSHYAHKHSGVVVEFEVDEMIPGVQLSNYAFEVRYRTNPPTISALFEDMTSFVEAEGMTSFEEAYNRMFTTKALEWSYEEEVRIQYPSPNHLKEDEPSDQPFDPKCIRRVIVGCNLELGSKEWAEIDHLADSPIYRHVLFQRAFLDPNDYKLRFADRPRN